MTLINVYHHILGTFGPSYVTIGQPLMYQYVQISPVYLSIGNSTHTQGVKMLHPDIEYIEIAQLSPSQNPSQAKPSQAGWLDGSNFRCLFVDGRWVGTVRLFSGVAQEIQIGDRDWGSGSGFELGIGIGDRDWGMGLGIGIGDRDW